MLVTTDGLVQAVLVTRALYKPCWLRGSGTSRAGYEGLVQSLRCNGGRVCGVPDKGVIHSGPEPPGR